MPHSVGPKKQTIGKQRLERSSKLLLFLEDQLWVKASAKRKISYSGGTAGLKSVTVQTELLCRGGALNIVNLRNFRMSHCNFQSLGEFAFAASDAKAESKSAWTRDLTEPKLKTRELGPEPAALETCQVPSQGADADGTLCIRWIQQTDLHQTGKKELSHSIEGNSRLLHKIHIEESAKFLCIRWKFCYLFSGEVFFAP